MGGNNSSLLNSSAAAAVVVVVTSVLNAAIMPSSSVRLGGGRLRRLEPRKTSVMCISKVDIGSSGTGEVDWMRSMQVWRADLEVGSRTSEM